MIMRWLRRGKTCNSRFVHKMTNRFFLHFFSLIHYFWNFLHKWDWIKTSTTPPTQRIWHFWSKIPDPVFVFVPLKACCGRPNCAAIYKTSLPTMTPTTKKSTMRATVRALIPSSFFMPTEVCWDDIMLLFLIRRPSSSWNVGKKKDEYCGQFASQ